MTKGNFDSILHLMSLAMAAKTWQLGGGGGVVVMVGLLTFGAEGRGVMQNRMIGISIRSLN